MINEILIILAFAFLQSVSYSLTSRSRNRDNATYHVIAALLANAIWFCTFKKLTEMKMEWFLIVPYTFGTVAGSLIGTKISMSIERWLGAASDSHLK